MVNLYGALRPCKLYFWPAASERLPTPGLERNITCGIRKRNGSLSHVHALGINNGLQRTSMGDCYQKIVCSH